MPFRDATSRSRITTSLRKGLPVRIGEKLPWEQHLQTPMSRTDLHTPALYSRRRNRWIWKAPILERPVEFFDEEFQWIQQQGISREEGLHRCCGTHRSNGDSCGKRKERPLLSSRSI